MLLRFLLFFSVLDLVASNVGPIHILLSRRSSSHLWDLKGYPVNRVRARDSFETLQHERRQSSAGTPLLNQNSDIYYLAKVDIGTPPQSFEMVISLGTADMWVAGSMCLTCGPSIPQFDVSNSSTFNASSASPGIHIPYGGGGSVLGQTSQDTVTMASFTVSSQTFVVANTTSLNLISSPASGVIGFAFKAIAVTQAPSFGQNLLNSSQLAQPLFSLYLTRFGDVRDAGKLEPGGFLTLGGTNSSLYTGDIEYINMPSNAIPGYWGLNLTGLNVRGQSVAIDFSSAFSLFDTASTYIWGPDLDVQQFWAEVPNATQMTGSYQGYWSIPCNTSLNASVSFGGQTWPIADADLVIPSRRLSTTQPDSATSCFGAIISFGSSGFQGWLMGDTFLKNVYSVFRATPLSIGFAQLSTSVLSPSTSSMQLTPTSSAPVHSFTFTPTPHPKSHGARCCNIMDGGIHGLVFVVLTAALSFLA